MPCGGRRRGNQTWAEKAGAKRTGMGRSATQLRYDSARCKPGKDTMKEEQKEEQKISRRKFVSTTTGTLATIPLVKHDADDVEVDRFAKRATEEGKKQFCDNCLHYKPSEEEGWGPCAIFPGFVVAAKGWCNVWVKAEAT